MYRLILINLIAISITAQTSHVISGPTPPAKCSPISGDVFYKTSISPAQLCICGTTNTWTCGSGVVATVTPTPNSIPKSDGFSHLAVGWLGSGTPDGTKFLRDDGVFSAVPGSGGATGPTDSLQVNLGGTPTGYSNLTFNPANGFTGTMNVSGNQGDPNFHSGFKYTCNMALEGLNFGFPDNVCTSISSTFTKGFNDSWQTSKASLFGILNQVTSRASGQRFAFGNLLNCLGMGDCYAFTQGVTQYGGLNDNGGEGTGHSRFTMSQGTELATASITSVPTQSHCTGTITQVVAQSTNQTPQLVNFTKTSGVSTCLTGEYIDIDRNPVYADTNHEIVILTTGFTGTQIAAVFETGHTINAPVNPASVLHVDDVHLMGEGRYLVNYSTVSHSGTVSGVSGHTVSINDTVAGNVVGGDTTLPGCWMATQDDYTGPPFNSSNFNTTLHSFYAMLGVGSSFNIAHKNPAGFAEYTGKATNSGGYSIYPCARIWFIPDNATVVLENNSFTWTAGNIVHNATSVDGVVANTNLFSWYTPGATLYNALFIGNSGPRSWQAAIALDSGNVTASNADTNGFDVGISFGGIKPYGLGISIARTITGAITIIPGIDQSSTVNSNISWHTHELGNPYIGPHGNTLIAGGLRVDGGAGNGSTTGLMQFGDSTSYSNNYGSTSTVLPQLQSTSNFMVTGYSTASGWLGVLNNTGQGWRLETNGQGPWNFHYFDIPNSIETYPFSVFSNGPNVPKLGVSTISTNYGSSAYGFSASLFHSGVPNNIGGNIDIEPERTGADSPFDFVFSIYDPANNTAWPNWPAVPLRISPTGVLSFGYHNDGYGPDNYAILDPTSISAHRTYTFPDWGGRFNVSGGLTTVGSLGTCNAGAEGQLKSVSDASAPAWGTTLVGGGAVHSGARCNGTNWLAY